MCRMFAVIRYESVIHEFDPYFNFRTTQKLTEEGWYEMYNWFDDTVWYPLGRYVGSTVYPGLMVTAGALYFLLHAFHFTIEIRNVCVFLGSFYAGNTALVTFLLTKQVHGKAAGLVAATLISIVPGYCSRSVAGSYDNEAIAIFCLIFTFYTWIKAVVTGTMKWAGLCAIAYFYMVMAWGGYIYIVNLIPLYTLFLLLTGRYTHKLYVAYSTYYILGTLLSMQVGFVGFKPVESAEHFAAAGVFLALQFYNAMNWMQTMLSKKNYRYFLQLVGVGLTVFFVLAWMFGIVKPFTGRFYTLLTGGKAEIPIIASVSEHQPTPWSSLFFDLNIALALAPAGLFICFRDISDASLFVCLYAITSCYFAGIMVRLVLVFAPATCILSGIALSEAFQLFSDQMSAALSPKSYRFPWVRIADIVVSVIVILGLFGCGVVYVSSSIWVTAEAYSSPSIVLSSNQGNNRVIIDDFREAYRWMWQNTAENAKFMAWWDYGYQMNAMGNRTTIADNNTWNNTHIATIGRVLSSTEEEAYKILRKLDVDYLLVIFGGKIGYSSDDINKFLWPVRISAGVYPEHVRERDFYHTDGSYRVDKWAPPTMKNSMMYKMCYYRFANIYSPYGYPSGFDRSRNAEIGRKNFKLSRIDEAFTSENWLVRIYKVLPERNHVGGP
eukprot:NODE_819_length_2332_cov_40.947488_g697_i0.p1 GENE.NODE_819_length_2332_cov_40.947488_g697_i0~~NODE_819_length_2332_cov_40.947488_g697_i0.p1  ORF type:complete len:749 (-),score=96.71 NODE_819_length_2332_cov_40.947488_g697_i0:84-2075(-)